MSVALIGAANAGKSSLLNHLVNKHISAVSNKASTTDEAIMGVYTDVQNRTQLLLFYTPGVVKASNSLRSKLLVTKAWSTIQESDHVLLIVDSVKRLNFEVKEAI